MGNPTYKIRRPTSDFSDRIPINTRCRLTGCGRFLTCYNRQMALYGPFYAGKNRPVGAKPQNKKAATRKASPAKKAASLKASPAKKAASAPKRPATRKAVAATRKGNCGNAARRLVGCRGRVKTRRGAVKCTGAGKNLISCRWRK